MNLNIRFPLSKSCQRTPKLLRHVFFIICIPSTLLSGKLKSPFFDFSIHPNMQTPQPPGCNCDSGVVGCPVQGKCQQTGVLYRASIRENMSGKVETYTGLTSRKFKDRWNEHNNDFEKPQKRTKTMLSTHVWNLKDKGLDFIISWEILDRCPSYNPISKKCTFCLKEMFFLLCSTLKTAH